MQPVCTACGSSDVRVDAWACWDPSLADWWIEQEAKVANRTGPDGRACESMKRFRLGETYAELKAAALAERDLLDQATAPDDEGGLHSVECHCTD